MPVPESRCQHEYLLMGAAGVARDGVPGSRLAVTHPPSVDGRANERRHTAGLQLFIGMAEVFAAAGLTLPGITRYQPWLVSRAAAGLMIVMISATIFHSMRGEVSSAITTALLLVVVTFVAYMRWRVAPIRPRMVA